ncbi:MAG: hypothetical protein IJW83_01780 [Clostridia bacterium]|nr:hypothetical protein [Clostridia bacterium]
MKRCFILCLCLCLLFSLCACNQVPPEEPDTGDTPTGETPPAEEYPDDLLITPSSKIPIADLVSITYTDDELSEIETYMYSIDSINDRTIEALNAQYPIECVRWISFTSQYRVSYLGESGILSVMFDANGIQDTIGTYTFDTNNATLDTIQIGDSQQHVAELDPNFEYQNHNPQYITTHISSDGFLYEFVYDIDANGVYRVAYIFKVLL